MCENIFLTKKKKKKIEVLSMLCNIKSLTSRCLKENVMIAGSVFLKSTIEL